MSDEIPANNRSKTGKPRPTAFRKGQSGNPAGRKKGTPNKVGLSLKQFFTSIVLSPEWQEQFRRWAMTNQLAPSVTVQMLDRVAGKPETTLRVTMVSPEALKAMDPDELAEWKAMSVRADALIAKHQGRQF